MGKLYLPGEQDEPGAYASALAIGDSWFWYPNQNLMETLVRHPRTSMDHANVRLLGFPGAQLREYVGAGRYAKEVDRWLSPAFNGSFSEFYISGAGNDAVAYDLALKANCAQWTDPADCIDPDGMSTLLRGVSEALGALIHNIRWAYRDSALKRPIFIHGYDYPTPDGRAFNLGPMKTGPWLAPAMDKCFVRRDMALRFGITKILIDRLNKEVFACFDAPENEIVYIDCRRSLAHYPDSYKADWTNELHPTSAGFREIFESRWIPVLADHGICTPAPLTTTPRQRRTPAPV